jgi:hypothetical protein
MVLFSLWVMLGLEQHQARAGGVTVITHGYNSDVTSWITAMTSKIPSYTNFPGTNFTVYTLSVTYSGTNYVLSTTRSAGGAPSATDSGEVIVKLDWSTLSGGIFSTYSTYDVAAAVAYGLLQTNLISELGGHSLVEWPLHLAGHSRGGSLISEISRILGTNGVWVDHLTTMDPHPLNNDGFNDSPIVGTDAPVRTYVNVLFHDNYWENLGSGLFDPNGEPVFGAYIRRLYNLSGGYHNTSVSSPNHSNVHLWYQGTIDWVTPSSDGSASITTAERTNWWTAYEESGTNAGFLYTLIGGGNRLSTDQPLGQGFPSIRDGFNQWWDLGAGQSSNRIALTSNNGNWPSLIRFDRMETNNLAPGQSVPLKLYYQWAQPTNSQATVKVYLDNDRNPLDSNDALLSQFSVPGTGSNAVNAVTTTVSLNSTNSQPGLHFLYATITGGARTRLLYAPEPLQIAVNLEPPVLQISLLPSDQLQISISGTPGQTLVLQGSSNLLDWQALATNTLAASPWVYLDSQSTAGPIRFYRAYAQ